jgi:hypothetical protein
MIAVMIDFLVEARTAHQRNDWRASYAAFVRADGLGPMPADDLDAYSVAAWRLGHGREAVRLAEQVYDKLVRTDPSAAAMKAVDLNLVWRTRGHRTIAADWAAKASVLLKGTPIGVVHGYLAYANAVAAIDRGDVDALSQEMRTLDEARRHVDDPALTVLGSVIEGVAAMVDGRHDEGLRILDSVLLPMVDPRVRVEWGGDAYRLAIWVGEQRGDYERVRAWLGSMQTWCEAVDSDAYRAICDVHRIRADADRARLTRNAMALRRAVVDVDASAGAILEELLAGH